MGKIFKLLSSRLVTVGVLIILQALVLLMLMLKLSQYFAYVYAFFLLLSTIMVFYILSKEDNPSLKLPWVIAIMAFPLMGGVLYCLFSDTKVSKKKKNKMKLLEAKSNKIYELVQNINGEIEDKHILSQSRYIKNITSMPLYKNTYTEYFPIGEIMFEKMKEELRKAKHYIFLEYFIIEEGVMWNELLEILKIKVQEGLDVRVMYDDCGSLLTLPRNYDKTLEAMGIKSVVFNPYRPILSTSLHNRDHRKIMVIDGHTGFTGGINLADEYINKKVKHGHWKDTGVLLKGDGVLSLTMMFLESWNFYRETDSDYNIYMPHIHQEEKVECDGYVQPYGDSPLDKEYVGETIYMNIINQAKEYVYICTPYFIVDNETVTSLLMAAKRGIDVRIMTPGIGDKGYVHMMTRSYYTELIKAGVKIYEYTPGFVHAKSFVADDEIGVVGTINMDYRSLYHNYECATWMYKSNAVKGLKEDFMETLKECKQIDVNYGFEFPFYKKFALYFIKLISPLM